MLVGYQFMFRRNLETRSVSRKPFSCGSGINLVSVKPVSIDGIPPIRTCFHELLNAPSQLGFECQAEVIVKLRQGPGGIAREIAIMYVTDWLGERLLIGSSDHQLSP